MKKKIILSYLGLSLLFISSFAQCTLCSPFWATNQGTISTNLFNDWSFAYINGDWGQDYVAFQAEAGKAYMFTTLPQFGGATQGISQNDAQLTIVNPFTNLMGCNEPAAGNSFNDDYNAMNLEPLLIWKAPFTGTYYLYATEYPCKELGPGQQLTIAFIEIPLSIPEQFAIWTGQFNDNWFDSQNWIYETPSGSIVQGRPSSFRGYDVFIWGTNYCEFNGGRDTCDHFMPEAQASFGMHGGEIQIDEYLVNQPETSINNWGLWTSSYGEIFSNNSPPGTFRFSKSQPYAKNMTGVQVKFRGGPHNLTFDPTKGSSLYGLEVDVINKLILEEEFEISNSLKLTSGQLALTKKLLLGPYAQISGASLTRFINPFTGGWVEKTTNQAFTIPFGTGPNFYRPIQISPNSSYSSTWKMTYEQGQTLGNVVGPGLHHVSKADLWTAEKLQGEAGLKGLVRLYWGDCSGVGNMSPTSDLRVVGWDTQQSKWIDLGNQYASMNGNSGEILSSTVDFDKYKYFTLASISTKHPLLNCYIGNRLSDPAEKTFAFSLFPNPATSYVTVQTESDLSKIQMIDIAGRIVLSPNIPKGTQQFRIPLAGMSPGIYQLLVQDSNGNCKSRKLIVK